MHPRSLVNPGSICLRCQWRLLNRRRTSRDTQGGNRLSSVNSAQAPQRALHVTAIRTQLSRTPTTTPPPVDPALFPRPPQLPIRQHLEKWQQLFGGPSEESLAAFRNHPAHDQIHNGLSKLSSGLKADENVDSQEWDDEAVDGDEGEEIITIGLFLKPGDVVELSQPGREPVLAVFVQQLNDVSQFFSVNGRWCHSLLTRVSFAITGCIDPSILQPLVPFLPTAIDKAAPKGEVHVPTHVGAPVQAILEGMTEDAEQIYRTNAPILDTAYAKLADATRVRMMTLTQIAKKLLAPNDPSWIPAPSALLAVRKALHHNEFRFRSDARSHRLTNTFAIRPKNDVQVVETVHEWLREFREHLARSANKPQDSTQNRTLGVTYVMKFLEKARKLIAHSRKDRDPTPGSIGPSKARLTAPHQSIAVRCTWGEPFTATDKQIINLLQAWVLTGQFTAMSGLHAACANLIHATRCYGVDVGKKTGVPWPTAGTVKRSTGMLFLQEIGVLSPHENRAIYDEELMLPTVRLSRNIEYLNSKAELTRRTPDFRDAMRDLRRDWKSLTVFCIDDVGAHEIDDGISIERVNGHDLEYWIHVHVANPTAFFDKTHTLTSLAAHATETVYCPEQTFPMLPRWATQGYFSLERDRPAITFSSRIDRVGNMLETKIQNGIIRKIVSITPSEVASLLGETSTIEVSKLVVGGEVPKTSMERSTPKVSPSEVQDLRNLYAVTQALWAKRRAAGGVRFGANASSVRVFENAQHAGLTWSPPSIERARLAYGDPIIEVTTSVPTDLVQYTVGPTNIVEEMMILAGQTAASWCTERHIPIMYRGTIEHPASEGFSAEYVKELVQPYLLHEREMPRDLAMRYTESLGRSIAHFAPLPHKIIGVASYVKVTSPLRRFSDMIAHWQIEAALRSEAQSGKNFNANDHTSALRGLLPFSHRQMQESIVTLSPRERIIKTTKRNSSRFWQVLALMRAFYYKEAPLPQFFNYWVRKVPFGTSTTVLGYLPQYGVRASMYGERSVQVGDEWEVEIINIDMFSSEIFVRPLRLVYRQSNAL